MIKICILNTDILDEQLIDTLPFGETERQRLTAMDSSKHKRESLGGLIALKRLVEKSEGLSCTEILRDTRGKPRFSGENPLPFGISHSGGIAAAALGDTECVDIGFDLEAVRDDVRTAEIAERYFSETEKAEFEKNGRTTEAFFSIWTAKEAYAKLDGRGLADIVSKKKKQISENAYLYRLTADIGGRRVIMSVVCKCEGQPIQIFSDTEENA